MIHQVNILIHVLAGTTALLVGGAALLTPKYLPRHARLGRIFLYLLSVVVATGFVGWLFFRSNNFLLMLTLLSGYVGYAGWRCVRLKEKKASAGDALVAILALTLGVLFMLEIRKQDGSWNPVVIYSTLGALGVVTVYDLVKYFWLHHRLRKWWIYEHIYKLVSAFSATLAAFTGTVLPDYKPYSQILPSAFCTLLILVLIIRQARKQQKKRRVPVQELN
ncbi:hypothetical protein [Telluribacter sp. SYSU D00476]|uniref:hypothetical protein n=1 Tax=Telluribacter sp. SYSU D00476 TaxID=2811430 RepID=UPI001FF5A812|nr:hypothetical protein [Telluribacter sp. SYSU D00476]